LNIYPGGGRGRGGKGIRASWILGPNDVPLALPPYRATALPEVSERRRVRGQRQVQPLLGGGAPHELVEDVVAALALELMNHPERVRESGGQGTGLDIKHPYNWGYNCN